MMGSFVIVNSWWLVVGGHVSYQPPTTCIQLPPTFPPHSTTSTGSPNILLASQTFHFGTHPTACVSAATWPAHSRPWLHPVFPARNMHLRSARRQQAKMDRPDTETLPPHTGESLLRIGRHQMRNQPGRNDSACCTACPVPFWAGCRDTDPPRGHTSPWLCQADPFSRML